MNFFENLICFGVNGVNVFQGIKNVVTKHILDTYAPHSIRVHCMAHCINFVVQTLLSLLLVVWIEILLQCLNCYFPLSFKRHLELTKILKFMAIKGNKILQNVKIMWISMLSLTKKVMAKYKTLLMKMALDILTNQ